MTVPGNLANYQYIPVGLKAHSIKASDLAQIFLQFLVQTAVTLSLLHRGVRMDVGKLGPGDGLEEE